MSLPVSARIIHAFVINVVAGLFRSCLAFDGVKQKSLFSVMEIEHRVLGILGKDSTTKLDSTAMIMSNMMAFSVLLGLSSSRRPAWAYSHGS